MRGNPEMNIRKLCISHRRGSTQQLAKVWLENDYHIMGDCVT